MHTLIHIVIGLIAMIALGLHGHAAVIFFLAAVMIDIDHLIELLHGAHNLKTKYIWDVGGFRKANYEGVQRSLHIFHTFEFVVALFIAAKYFAPLFYVGAGFSVHMLTDAWGNIWNRNIRKKGGSDWAKYWFIVYYIRKGSVFNAGK